MEQQICQQAELLALGEEKVAKYREKINKLQSTILKVGEIQD